MNLHIDPKKTTLLADYIKRLTGQILFVIGPPNCGKSPAIERCLKLARKSVTVYKDTIVVGFALYFENIIFFLDSTNFL